MSNVPDITQLISDSHKAYEQLAAAVSNDTIWVKRPAPPTNANRKAPTPMATATKPKPISFKVGDRVELIKEGYDYFKGKKGTVGTVIGTTFKAGCISVQFDVPVHDAHDCQGNGKDGYCWNFSNGVASTYLKKIRTAAKTKAKVEFSKVVIDDYKREQIMDALAQVHHYELIFEKWGFGETLEKGKGISMLFYGPPGTGKTLMGQAIANELKQKLLVISTADFESSVPGEAERNIRKLFTDAQEQNGVILFDECDSLVFSRKSVGPILSAQINELLSQLERHEGVTIFTTNRLGTLDEAINRRLALKLEFGMPSAAQRKEIWLRMFPKKAPVAKDVDWDRLASIEITGGYIKNATLRAARMAAAENVKKKQITMDHLVKALRQEAISMAEFEKARQEHEHGYGYVHGGRVRSKEEF